jgi:hypothetical protein
MTIVKCDINIVDDTLYVVTRDAVPDRRSPGHGDESAADRRTCHRLAGELSFSPSVAVATFGG